MSTLFFYLATLLLLIGVFSPSFAQLSVGPRANMGILLGPADDYADPQIGYGIEANVHVSDQLSAGLAIDRYIFQLDISSLDLNVGDFVDIGNLLRNVPINFTIVPVVAGFRYTLPGEKFRPYIGIEGGLHYITAEGLGLEISRRFWGIAPVVGGLIPLSDRFGIFANAKLQWIMARDRVPIIGQELEEELVFMPLQAGLLFYLIK